MLCALLRVYYAGDKFGTEDAPGEKPTPPILRMLSSARYIDTHNADAIVGHLPAESTLIHRSQAPVAHNIEPLLNDCHRGFRPSGAQYTAAPELVSRPLARAIVEVIAVPARRPLHESETTTRVNKYMRIYTCVYN